MISGHVQEVANIKHTFLHKKENKIEAQQVNRHNTFTVTRDTGIRFHFLLDPQFKMSYNQIHIVTQW